MVKMQTKKTAKEKKNWLIKFAPFRTSWADIVRRGTFTMRGVRNRESRNNLQSMSMGDRVLFYHSQQERAIVGVLEVTRTAYPEPGSADPQWVTCDFRPLQTFDKPVPLTDIKKDPRFHDFPLVRRPRLSVIPVPAGDYAAILCMGVS